MATGKTSTHMTQSQLSVDAEPWTTPEQDNAPSIVSLTSANVSVDAVPGRRNAAAIRRPPPMKVSGSKQQGSPSEKMDMKPLKSSQDEDVTDQVRKRIEDLELSSSLDSSYGSYSPDSEKSNSLMSLDDEIQKYFDKMPGNLVAPFIDVLILYAAEDRKEAEVFRQHLIKEIILPDRQLVRALLYDCPEFSILSGSQWQHLDLAVERSTYVFVYLTKSFVDCKWCEISSESCLMKAIYDDEKRWGVVPVYTQKRNKCDFKIPMGLNSLKGINYYNNDEFYRKGVARLIGDKIHVKFKAMEILKIKQKEWIEKYKREQKQIEDEQIRVKLVQENITWQFDQKLKAEREQWQKKLSMSWSDSNLMNLSSMHHSPSTNSLKGVQDQNPNVQNYLDQMKLQALAQQSMQMGQYLGSRPSDSPPVGNAALYSHGQHAVQPSPSQSSAVSNDAANSLQIPQEILDKIKGSSTEEQKKYIDLYQKCQSERLMQEQQSLHLQQQAVLNMPYMQPPMASMFYMPPGQYPQMLQGQPCSMLGQPNSFPSLGMNSLMNAPNPSLNLGSHGQQGSLGNHGNQQQIAPEVTQASQIPNMEALSLHSYHPQSIAGTMGGNSNDTYSSTSNQESYSTGGGYSGPGVQGQSMDGPRSSYRGNLPDSGLFNSDSQESSHNSLEQDSGSYDASAEVRTASDRMQKKEVEMNAEDPEKPESMEDDIKGNQETKAKKEKHVHYTINIYQAGSVQVGDSNIVQQAQDNQEESENDSGEDTDDGGDEPGKSIVKQPHQTMNVKPGRFMGEIPEPSTNHETAIPDAPPSTTSTISERNPFIPQPGTINFNSNTVPKASAGIKPIGTVSPQIQRNYADDDDKDDSLTAVKTVVPTSQTARKTVNDSTSQNASSDSDNGDMSNDNSSNETAQVPTTSPAGTRPAEHRNDSQAVNTVSPSQRSINAVSPNRPVQTATPTQFRSHTFTTNPTELFYRRREQQYENVEIGEDPLSQAGAGRDNNNQLGESAGFSPNSNDTECDFDMLTHDDYEGGEFTESIEHSLEKSGSSRPKRLLETIFSRISNKINT